MSTHTICSHGEIRKISGPSCSKLMMSLVNILIKTLIIKYAIYANIFAAEKM